MNHDTVTCFWCEPSDRGEESLRRFCFDNSCPNGYHNVSTVLGEVDLPLDAKQYGDDNFDHAHPSWPAHCSCGYAFQPGDEWQHNLRRKWRRTDTDALHVLDELPPGAMYDADWYGEKRVGPDGIHLIVIGPAQCGPWNVDGPSAGGGAGWARTGDPRRPETLSCTPSIWWGKSQGGDREWHGHLTGGILKPC